jgi:cytoskeleton protein RodZ
MSLGSQLSAAREQAGLTLEQVSERTRIRRTVIARIEADDFTLCGGDVYARGHVRTMARVAGVDPEPLVAEFDRVHAPDPPTATEVFEAETHVARERSGPNWTAAMAAAVVVLLALAGFQLLRGGSPGTVVAPPTSSGPGVSTGQPSSSGPSPSTSTSPTLVAKVPPSAQGVAVRLTISGGRSWVSVTAGGRKVFEGLLADGAVKLFDDPKQVKVVVGNAGVVRLVVNGIDLGAAGASGQVVRLTFGPGNPTGPG